MWLYRTLRRMNVAKRATIAVLTLAVPTTVLIAVTVIALQREETHMQRAVDEAVDTLVPIATLQYDLQRALTDDLEAESGESVPDFGSLTTSIDRAFTQLRSGRGDRDLPAGAVKDAQSAWQSARPTIARLVERVTSLHLDTDAGTPVNARDQLRRALDDVQRARTHLAQAVRHRIMAAKRSEGRLIHTLLAAWAATLFISMLLLGGIVHSIVRPAGELSRAVRRLGAGDLTIRVDEQGGDELADVSRYLNAMAARFESRRQDLVDEARRDALTQLPNRRAIETNLTEALASKRLLGTPVSVLLIDVDRFKSINDRFGHTAGDRALIWLADRMRGLLRQEDTLGRYAGDEFLAVLPDTAEADANQIATRLCDLINRAAMAEPQTPTVTIGVAASTAPEETATSLIQRADEALYRGKHAGRAQATSAGSQ